MNSRWLVFQWVEPKGGSRRHKESVKKHTQACQLWYCSWTISNWAFCMTIYSSLQVVVLVCRLICAMAQVARYYTGLPAKKWNTTFRSVYFFDPKSKDAMEFTTDTRSNMCATKSNLTTAPSNLECVTHGHGVDVEAITPPSETALPEPTCMISMRTAPSVMQGVTAAHTITYSNKDATGTLVKNDGDGFENKPRPLLKSVFGPSFGTLS